MGMSGEQINHKEHKGFAKVNQVPDNPIILGAGFVPFACFVVNNSAQIRLRKLPGVWLKPKRAYRMLYINATKL